LFDWVQIESNGIPAVGQIVIDDGREYLKTKLHEDVTLVVSPKCVEIDGRAARYLKPHTTTLIRANCLKFVVTSDERSAYNTVPDWALSWQRETGRPIYVSPMNVYLREPQATLLAAKSDIKLSPEQRTELERISFWEKGLLDQDSNQRNHEHAAFLCMKHGFRLSLQTHLYASLP
jgi:organic radical activating enzyme